MNAITIIFIIFGAFLTMGIIFIISYFRKMINNSVYFQIPGMDSIKVIKDISYGSDPLNKMDIYLPKDYDNSKKYPAVIFLSGDVYSFMASGVKNWQLYQEYGKILAASGFVAITFNRRMSPGFSLLNESFDDIKALCDTVKNRAVEWSIDTTAISLWSFSGGGIYLGKVIKVLPFKSIVCFYCLFEPMQFRKYIAKKISDDTLKAFSFLQYTSERNPLPPIFIAKAGKDRAMINTSLDDFVKQLTARKIDFSLEFHDQGKHGFDVLNKDDRTGEIIGNALKFLEKN
ncbi:MAG: hypothetical protein JEY99_21105 [Spirochaetales bacterium]|nr:hypothetical protein [Spirochaetales bacterium]